MYFPYVFGRGSELLALRSSSKSFLSTGLVVPIIEPIVTKSAPLLKAVVDMGERSQRAIVIVNPFQGELKGGPSSEWVASVDAVLLAHPLSKLWLD
jgi:hypothetical protein